VAAYYNEIEPYAAQWLRNLIAAGHIAPGEVDTRSIADVSPDDLRGFTQCHFFAGIGVWSYAARLARWPDDRPVWTGSCPCQPFSAAGRQDGTADSRHLWPTWHRLIRERRPVAIFGEQVAAAVGHAWLDVVFADLEEDGYAVGAVDFPACGIGAPHARQRVWFMACGYMGHANEPRLEGQPGYGGEGEERPNAAGFAATAGAPCSMADNNRAGCAQFGGRKVLNGERTPRRHNPDGRSPTSGFWGDADWLPCRDGKARPVEPGTFPLAHGSPARVGRLRGYGNAIVAPQAAAFVEAFLGEELDRSLRVTFG